jgi:hypothetical protein
MQKDRFAEEQLVGRPDEVVQRMMRVFRAEPVEHHAAGQLFRRRRCLSGTSGQAARNIHATVPELEGKGHVLSAKTADLSPGGRGQHLSTISLRSLPIDVAVASPTTPAVPPMILAIPQIVLTANN